MFDCIFPPSSPTAAEGKWLTQVRKIEQDPAEYALKSNDSMRSIANDIIQSLGKLLAKQHVLDLEEVKKHLLAVASKDHRLCGFLAVESGGLVRQYGNQFLPLHLALVDEDAGLSEDEDIDPSRFIGITTSQIVLPATNNPEPTISSNTHLSRAQQRHNLGQYGE